MERMGLLIALVLCMQQGRAQEENKEFSPSGNTFANIFSNYHYSPTEDDSGFELARAQFGYKYQMSPEWSGDVTFDVGNPQNGSSFEMVAYVKKAGLQYEKDKLQVNFGMIGLKQHKLQERQWGRRYVYKSFQDRYGLSASADLGAMLTYAFCDKFEVDATIRNGEGYKKLQSDNTYNGGIGITTRITDELTVRLYADLTSRSEMQTTIATFIGYKNEKLALAGEYLMRSNAGYVADASQAGISAYASYQLNEKYELFARYDHLASSTHTGSTDPWNYSRDGAAVIGGVQYKPIKNIDLALNYQGWSPADSQNDPISYIYLNLAYTF